MPALSGVHIRADRLVRVDGDIVESAQIKMIRPDGRVIGPGIPTPLILDDLRRIERTKAGIVRSPAKCTVDLIHPGHLPALRVFLSDERFHVRPVEGVTWSLSMDVVRGLRFDIAPASELYQRALQNPVADFDQVLIRLGDTIQIVPGLIESISESMLAFQWQNAQRQLPLSRVYGIVLAALPDVDATPPRATVALRNGSVMAARQVELNDDRLVLQLAGSEQLVVDWREVSQIEIRSDRWAFLSDLTPVEQEEQPLVTVPRTWQRDRSVLGRKLTIHSSNSMPRTYEKGIGTHASSRLVFDLDQRYDSFAATIGIDTETGGHGNCDFVVMADGEERLRRQMNGTDIGEAIHVDVRGIRHLALIIEAGEDLDLADHANWCDARVIRRAR